MLKMTFGFLLGLTINLFLNVVEPDDQLCVGEVGLFALNFGASDRLLNVDHDDINFKGMPIYKGRQLRRYGDIVKRTIGGYFYVQGRADDTMNLGVIKTSSVEIERVCEQADRSIMETCAVHVAPANGGPELLAIFVVLKDGFNGDPDKLKIIFSKATIVNSCRFLNSKNVCKLKIVV